MQHRDLLLRIDGDSCWVITADNAAGLGQARLDAVQVAPYIIGQLTARVALLEAVSVGAAPLLISNTLSFDYKSADGQEIQRGIMAAAAQVGLSADDISGSCEVNFPAELTCLGITVVAKAKPQQLWLGRVQPGDSCYLLGQPLVGPDVLAIVDQLLSLERVQQLGHRPGVHEIVPLGSGGAAAEIAGLSTAYNLQFAAEDVYQELAQRSAGPATAVLVVGQLGAADLKRWTQQKVTLLGSFHEVQADG